VGKDARLRYYRRTWRDVWSQPEGFEELKNTIMLAGTTPNFKPTHFTAKQARRMRRVLGIPEPHYPEPPRRRRRRK
jgi:hypothetical protein